MWNEVGYDLLSAVGEESGRGQRATVSKADVIEVVLDASRLEEQLRRSTGDKALVERVAADIYGDRSEVERFLKTDVFRYARYGF